MTFFRMIKRAALGMALAVTPIAASAAITVSAPDYGTLGTSATVALPGGASWFGTAPQIRTTGNVSGTARSPFDETSPISSYFSSADIPDTTPYFSVGPGSTTNSATLEFLIDQTSLSFLWGSPDGFNSLTFRLDGDNVASFTGNDVDPSPFGASFVTYDGLFDEVVFASPSGNAFEFSNLSAVAVPLPAGLVLMLTALGGLVAVRRYAA